MAFIGKDINSAAKLLKDGKLVAIPTETVYGLAADVRNEKAVLSIFEAKERPFFDPLIVHVHSFEAACSYATFNDERLEELARTFWPGPLTLLLPKKEVVPGIVTSGLSQVAIRVPDHNMTLELLATSGLALAAPSANPFGYISPTEPAHVEKQLGKKVSYILDGGICSVGIESTIVGVEDGQVCVYRLGGLATEDLVNVIGPVQLRINHSGDPKTPGQLRSHYAPKKPLFTGDLHSLLQKYAGKKTAVIYHGDKTFGDKNINAFNLSQKSNAVEAALNLFKYLREADESEADIVLAERFPDGGLGLAINDRLQRAAVQNSVNNEFSRH